MTSRGAERTAPPERPVEVVVVKLGGETLADQHDTLVGVAEVVRRHRMILVHGGGKRLSVWLARLGIQTRFEDGRRVTDDEALEAAVAVLGGLVNAELVASLSALGVRAVGLTGIDGGLLVAERAPELGRVGRVIGARPALLEALLGEGFVPVVAPIAVDQDGRICNVNADEVAAGLAASMRARLVLLTDTDGVKGADGRTIPSLDESAAQALIAAGTISGGMLPKVRGALDVVRHGAAEVVIADGRAAGALSRALDDRAAGTRVVAETDATTKRPAEREEGHP